MGAGTARLSTAIEDDTAMKKILSFLMLALALALSLPALAENVLYTGMVTRTMTIREKKSTSAKKLGSVEEG